VSTSVHVGLSGWAYRGWRGTYYPRGLPQRLELEHAAARVGSIELNGTFYSLQRPSSYRSWAARVPDGVLLPVKGPRLVTHLKRLRDVEQPLARFLSSGPLLLGDRLGPFLWQLPARTTFDPSVLEPFLRDLPRTEGEAARLARTAGAPAPDAPTVRCGTRSRCGTSRSATTPSSTSAARSTSPSWSPTAPDAGPSSTS
jgi:uncharacterized protein YecE (DUF72 family)